MELSQISCAEVVNSYGKRTAGDKSPISLLPLDAGDESPAYLTQNLCAEDVVVDEFVAEFGFGIVISY